MQRCLLVLAVASGAVALAATPPAPPKADYPLVDELTYPTPQAVQAAWKAMWGTAGAEPVEIEGRRALRLPCNFKGTRIERASWDRIGGQAPSPKAEKVPVPSEGKLDLTACQGIQFDVFCADASPVSHFSLYLHSGNGWYATGFAPDAAGAWCRVKIAKTDTRMEETPAGWGKIDTIRISAWRGGKADTEFYIANLGLLGADATIAVIRGESVAKNAPDESQSVSTFTKAVADTLDRLGLSYAVVSDLDVTPVGAALRGRPPAADTEGGHIGPPLRGKKIAILPHNPAMPDAVADALVEFIKSGGKLISFYILPQKLREAIGIPGGQHIQQTYRGHFAEIRAVAEGLAGMPKAVRQMSWNIGHSEAMGTRPPEGGTTNKEGRSRVVATWFNDKGESTGEAAIVASDNAIHMTHVLVGDDVANHDRLLLSMVGHFEPKLWQDAFRSRYDALGRFGPYKGWSDLTDRIREMAKEKPEAKLAVDEFLDAVLRARKIEVEGNWAGGGLTAAKWAEALAAVDLAREKLILAHCLIQKPIKGEHRAFWCHSAFGPAGMTWDESIKLLAENGFTAIVPNMLWGGLAYYESSVLPVAPEVKEKGDQIAQCVAACRKYGVQCHVWKVNWNMGGRAPKEFAERMKREGRTQVLFSGKPEDSWLCPSHPDNQQLEVDGMAEVAAKYDVDGIHFDYIRYPGPDGCFCPGCRERFEKFSHTAKVAKWPADTRNDEAIRQKWLDFRRDNITKVVAATAERVRKAKPNVKISAAVFPNWLVDRDGIGQDWKLWCEKGYLDFVCPMDYTANPAQFENLVKQQVEWAGKVPCYPGIGLGVWPPGDNIVKLIEFIQITRKLGTKGFTIFEYRAPEAAGIVPLCGKGITRKE